VGRSHQHSRNVGKISGEIVGAETYQLALIRPSATRAFLRGTQFRAQKPLVPLGHVICAVGYVAEMLGVADRLDGNLVQFIPQLDTPCGTYLIRFPLRGSAKLFDYNNFPSIRIRFAFGTRGDLKLSRTILPR